MGDAFTMQKRSYTEVNNTDIIQQRNGKKQKIDEKGEREREIKQKIITTHELCVLLLAHFHPVLLDAGSPDVQKFSLVLHFRK